ncbi:MAG: hypothetical protein WC712_13465 [Candidatus Brocadiia bacterium]
MKYVLMALFIAGVLALSGCEFRATGTPSSAWEHKQEPRHDYRRDDSRNGRHSPPYHRDWRWR